VEICSKCYPSNSNFDYFLMFEENLYHILFFLPKFQTIYNPCFFTHPLCTLQNLPYRYCSTINIFFMFQNHQKLPGEKVQSHAIVIAIFRT